MSGKPLTAGAALRGAIAHLQRFSPTAELDAAVLLGHVLGLSRAGLLAEQQRQLSGGESAAFAALLGRRANLEPVAYLVGEREFYGLRFAVDRRVLVPRPETELLVERALAWMAAAGGGGGHPIVAVDVGTGSGCIAVALAANAPGSHVYAIDLSPEALEVAAANIARHGVGHAVTPLLSDGLAALPEPVNLIVSNPPYTLIDEVDEGVRRHEPRLALDGGPDGLDAYRALIPAAAAILPRDRPAALMLEIGAWQGADVTAMARTSFPAATISLRQDLAGRDRVVEILINAQ